MSFTWFIFVENYNMIDDLIIQMQQLCPKKNQEAGEYFFTVLCDL